MAADRITVGLDLTTTQAQREVAKLQKKIDALSKSMGGAMRGIGGGGGGTDKVRALGTGLSKATVRADEFTKSLEASNARVIAFGASAGLIMQVDRALKAMVSSAIKVEKAMADVNVVMNASTKTLDRFGRGMFKVAKETAQGFDTVAEAATELARQGLGMEKTLARTKDALILTRLTGMNAADAVKSLTAAVNSFNKEGTTSAQVINRMAKVDAAFAVSSEDLARSISRVGSSAVDAGVSMNQLMAITTSVQQKTARGGAVIGNAFKTIFTRIQRSDVRKTLEGIGVATTDMNGKMLDGVTVLENLSRSFSKLTKTQQASVAENVAGVFQVNILKAAMSDLVNVNSEYSRALRIANTATDEAYVRNEQLNKTLDALANRTLANLTSAGATLGGGAFEPAIRKVLGTLNASIESFGKGGAMETVGETVGKGLLAGIGNFISGPGLVMIGAAITKLGLNLAKFAGTALKDFMGLNAAAKQRASLEEMTLNKLREQPSLITQIATGERTIASIQKEILATMELQTLERAQQATIARSLSTGMYAGGARVTRAGDPAFIGPVRPGKAGGFIPNFASAGAERAAAAAGGYAAGSIRTMSQPGAGTMMYNSAETVKQFPGMSQKAIMPPANSSAGANYKAAFGAAHGFNPYAASGFVPNFAAKKKGVEGITTIKANEKIGVLLGEGPSSPVPKDYTQLLFGEKGVKGLASMVSPQLRSAYAKKQIANPTIQIKGVLTRGVFPLNEGDINRTGKTASFKDEFAKMEKGLGNFAGSVRREIFGGKGGNDQIKNVIDFMGSGAKGDIFEASVRAALKQDPKLLKGANQQAPFDFNPYNEPDKDLLNLFGLAGLARVEAKIGAEAATNIVSKYVNEFSTGKTPDPAIAKAAGNLGAKFSQSKGMGKVKALGFVPNFSPLASAVNREVAAGVPASSIRVGSSPALRSSGNPAGIGVYNTIDEPAGLSQGINRSRAMGINPKSHGAANGFVPNYVIAGGGLKHPMLRKADMKPIAAAVDDGLSKPAEEMKDASGRMMMAGMMINMAVSGMASGMGASPKAQAGANLFSNVAGTAMMGAAFGPVGIAAGAGLGALSSLGDISTLMGNKDAQIAAEEFAKVSKVFEESIEGISGAMKKLASGDEMKASERIAAIDVIISKYNDIMETQPGSAGGLLAEVQNDLKEQINVRNLLDTGGRGLSEKDLNRNLNLLKRREGQLKVAAQAENLGLQAAGELTGMNGINFMIENFRGLGVNTDEKFRKGEAKRMAEILRQRPSLEAGSASAFLDLDNINVFGGERVGRGGAGRSRFNKTGITGVEAIDRVRARVSRGLDLEAGGDAAAAGKELKDANRLFVDLLNKSGKKILAKEFERLEKDAPLSTLASALAGAFSFRGAVGPTVLAGGAASLMNKGGAAGAGAGAGLQQGAIMRAFRQAQTGLTGEGLAGKFGAAAGTSRLARGAARRNLLRSNEARMAGITMAGDSLIDEKTRISELAALDKEETSKAKIRISQREKLNQAQLSALKSFVGKIEKTTMTLEDQNKFIENYSENYKNLTDKEIETKLVALEDAQSGNKVLTKQQEAEMEFLKQLAKERQANAAETKHLNDETIKQRKDEVKNIKETNKALKEQRQAMLEFQRDVRIQSIKDAVIKSGNEARGLRGLEESGFGITEREIAGANKKARRARIRAGGQGDPGQAFREAFAFGDTDAILEFEDGVVSVANSMKSSFSSAFQSIASGADTVGGAIANMANGILNSISQVSTNMFTNMLFSGLGPGKAQGGYIPGYNAGGLVTGGSGHKDDVLTRMRGGEFVIKKSAVNKIGLPALNAINGYSNGGPTMGQMGLIAAGSTAAAGIIGSAMQPGSPSPAPSQNYGYGRGAHGYFGGPDPDARGGDVFSGGGGRAGVSLNKAFVYYRRDPQTGQLVSERARPTEGRFEVSRSLSLLGRLGADDPQTARMFEKEQAMGKYQGYLATETQRRKDAVDAVKSQKRGRLISAYMNAAMLIGGAKWMDSRNNPAAGQSGNPIDPNYMDGIDSPYAGTNQNFVDYSGKIAAQGTVTSVNQMNLLDSYQGSPSIRNNMIQGGASGTFGSTPGGKYPYGFKLSPGNANGGLARVMGGEYIMSPEAVRTHGVGFMTELNRGNVPGYASGGLVGGGGAGMVAGGAMTNNVNINVNIDKNGKATAESDATSGKSGPSERDQQEEVENNKELGKLLQGVVVQEIVKQQRPGGLLNRGTTGVRSGGY